MSLCIQYAITINTCLVYLASMLSDKICDISQYLVDPKQKYFRSLLTRTIDRIDLANKQSHASYCPFKLEEAGTQQTDVAPCDALQVYMMHVLHDACYNKTFVKRLLFSLYHYFIDGHSRLGAYGNIRA